MRPQVNPALPLPSRAEWLAEIALALLARLEPECQSYEVVRPATTGIGRRSIFWHYKKLHLNPFYDNLVDMQDSAYAINDKRPRCEFSEPLIRSR
jgi:hypothetical protein